MSSRHILSVPPCFCVLKDCALTQRHSFDMDHTVFKPGADFLHEVQLVQGRFDAVAALAEIMQAEQHGLGIVEHDIDIVPTPYLLHDFGQGRVVEEEITLFPIDINVRVHPMDVERYQAKFLWIRKC